MFSDLTFQNAENSVILAVRADGTGKIIEPNEPDLWALAVSGNLGAVAPFVPPDPPTAAELLAQERAGMTVFARAFFEALKLFPSGTDLHMLDTLTKAIALLDQYDSLRIWREEVTQLIRDHPDMTAFGSQFGLSPLELDVIFRVAMAVEAGASPSEIAALMA